MHRLVFKEVLTSPLLKLNKLKGILGHYKTFEAANGTEETRVEMRQLVEKVLAASGIDLQNIR